MSEYETMQVFAENLRSLIARKGVPQRYLAQQLEVSQQILSQWCNGKKMPRMDKVEKIAAYFGCTTPELISKQQPDRKRVPLLGGAACGVGSSMAILEDIEKPDFIDADCAFQCRGESMASQGIHDNDVVYVKTGIYSDGVIHCVRIDDSYVLKKLYRSQNGFLLTSDIDPITVSGEQEDYEIVGKAVYILHAV